MKWIIASDLHGSAHYCRQLLEAWKREEAPRMLFLGDLLYHGPRNDLPEGYAPKEVIALHPGDVLLHGHTHIPRRTLRDGVYVLNPGSVSIPKAGSWHGYMTLEDGVFTWKTLSGDVRDTLRL